MIVLLMKVFNILSLIICGVACDPKNEGDKGASLQQSAPHYSKDSVRSRVEAYDYSSMGYTHRSLSGSSSVYVEVYKAVASDFGASDRMGQSVAMHGRIVVVGVYGDDSYRGITDGFHRAINIYYYL